MTTAGWFIVGFVILLAAAIGLEASLKRGRRRTLSSTQPAPKTKERELGQEATDVDLVDQTHARNRKIERTNWRWSRRNR